MASSGSAAPGARIDMGRGPSGDVEVESAVGDLGGQQGSVGIITATFALVHGYKFGSEKASALNTYVVMKSGGGTGPGARIDAGHSDLGDRGAPPPPATSTLEYKFGSEKASALNIYAVSEEAA